MSDDSTAQLRAARRDRLLGLLSTSWLAQACYVLAKLGLADLMAEGPRSSAELAEKSGADLVALRRLLAALATAGLLQETDRHCYALTPMTEFLRSDVVDSARQTAILYGEEVFQSFAEILHTIQTGEPAFTRAHGMGFYEYVETFRDKADTFNAAMGAQPIPEALFDCELPDSGTVVDVGGGNGRLLADLLGRFPRMKGVLLELPSAARQAKELFIAEGVANRVDIIEGSFFDSVPASGHVFLLSRVLHNWSDDRAALALRVVRASMTPESRLIVLERFLPAEPIRTRSAARAKANMVDLLMLVMLEGHDRTEAEYRSLLEQSGLCILASHSPGAGGVESAIEATLAEQPSR